MPPRYSVRTMKQANAQAEVAVPGRRRSPHADRPVFVAEHSWRERAVRAALGVLAALLLVWLLALIAGALGFGSLPPLPASGGDDTGSAPSQSEPSPASARVTPGKGREVRSSPLAARRGGQPGTVPTRRAAHSTEGAPASGANPGVDSHSAGVESHTAGVESHTAGKGVPAGSEGQGEAGADPPASQQTGVKANPDGAAGSGGAESPVQQAVTHGPPPVTPSGNEVPTGAGDAPSAKAEALGESPSGAHNGATETGRPG
jgi:hypothetical protein